jgi:hypothetical protein
MADETRGTMKSTTVGYIAMGLAAVLSTAGALGAAYFGIAKHTPVVPAVTPAVTPSATLPASLADRWVELDPLPTPNHGTPLDVRAKHWTLILDLTLPAGPWVLHAEQTIVNVGQPDFARCVIATDDQGSPQDALVQQTTYVGGTGVMAAVISETAAVTLAQQATMGVFCDHDTATPATSSSPYVDPGADLWAHQSGSLIATHMVPLWT